MAFWIASTVGLAVAYLFGSVQDFEKQQRAPKWIYDAAGWQVDDALGSTWGYTEGMSVRPAESVIRELVEVASMGGKIIFGRKAEKGTTVLVQIPLNGKAGPPA